MRLDLTEARVQVSSALLLMFDLLHKIGRHCSLQLQGKHSMESATWPPLLTILNCSYEDH